MQMEITKVSNNLSATRIVASTFGILVGLAGIDHGIFEILQGDVKPDGLMIAAIGPAQRFWEHGTETALTVIPSFLVTGILAVILGLLVILWAAGFVHKRYGARILLLLAVTLFLVGGGFAPIFLTLLATLTATLIHKPLTWWRAHIPAAIQSFLARLWPWSLIALVLIFFVSVEVAIFGYPLVSFFGSDGTLAILNQAANIMLLLMLLAPLTAFAYDTESICYPSITNVT